MISQCHGKGERHEGHTGGDDDRSGLVPSHGMRRIRSLPAPGLIKRRVCAEPERKTAKQRTEAWPAREHGGGYTSPAVQTVAWRPNSARYDFYGPRRPFNSSHASRLLPPLIFLHSPPPHSGVRVAGIRLSPACLTIEGGRRRQGCGWWWRVVGGAARRRMPRAVENIRRPAAAAAAPDA
jgi:hypothetical protein